MKCSRIVKLQSIHCPFACTTKIKNLFYTLWVWVDLCEILGKCELCIKITIRNTCHIYLNYFLYQTAIQARSLYEEKMKCHILFWWEIVTKMWIIWTPFKIYFSWTRHLLSQFQLEAYKLFCSSSNEYNN